MTTFDGRCKFVVVLMIGAVGLMLSSTVAAQTADESPDFSANPELMGVSTELGEAWREDSEAFEHVDAVRQWVVDWDRTSTPRPPNVARMLRAGGPDVLIVILWRIAADQPLSSGMSLEAWRQWRIGLLEAAGRMRDERSIPVLYSVIAGSEPSSAIRQVATSALGRVGDEASIERVIGFAKSSPPAIQQPIVAGLGDGRRLVALDYLLDVIDEASDRELRRVAIRSVGDWSNQWAWQTSPLEPYIDEGRAGRRQAIEALVTDYPIFDEILRNEAFKSLQLAGATDAARRADEEADDAVSEQHRRAWRILAGDLRSSPLE